MKILQTIVKVFRNKYFIALAAFVVWMLFFDARDWALIAGRKQKLNELQKNEEHLAEQIKETRKELNLLKTSASTIEKYAREKYHMKKDNEDIFIVDPTK